jgi:hypothetical protein
VVATAIAAHLIGGAGLVLTNRDRIRGQSGVGINMMIKSALTATAVGTTADSGVLGAKLARAGDVPTEGGTVPGDASPANVRHSTTASPTTGT